MPSLQNAAGERIAFYKNLQKSSGALLIKDGSSEMNNLEHDQSRSRLAESILLRCFAHMEFHSI